MDWFDEILAKYPRIAIAGGPRCGKTTLSERVTDRFVLHTDKFITSLWSKQSEKVAAFSSGYTGPICVEGMVVPRALRKGMRVDVVIWLDTPFEVLTPGQQAMHKQVRTILNEVLSEHNVTCFIILDIETGG